MSSKDTRSFLIGRDSRTGKLESVQQARRHPDTSQVERMPKPGRGDAPKKK